MRLYKILTGLLILLFFSITGYFIIYPLFSNFIDIKDKITDLEPYDMGFRSTMEVLMELTDPKYDEDSFVDTVEFVPENVKTAGLEDLDTVLEIPDISVKGKVVDGQSQESMLRGFWHHPLSDIPGRRGNVVIFGHRFDRVPPNPLTFFNLDKVDVGDKIVIHQEDRELEYKVIKIFEAEKNDQKIFSNITDYQLTLVTCTPLWTSEKRLVIVAAQVWVNSVI